MAPAATDPATLATVGDRTVELYCSQAKDTTYKGRKPPLEVRQQWYREARELVASANRHHAEAGKHQRQALFHAKEAGNALMEAKHKVRYTQWGKFLSKEFDGSRETARVYMRVARHWDDPRIQQARHGRMTPTSIAGFLDILRNTPAETKRKPTEPQQVIIACRSIRDKLTNCLRSLEPEELDVLDQSFSGAWEKLHEWLKEAVLMVYEDAAGSINETYRLEIQRIEDAKRSRYRGRQRMVRDGLQR